jgi:hypothetical protein
MALLSVRFCLRRSFLCAVLSDYSPGDDVKTFDQAKALDKINERLPPSRRMPAGLGDGNAANHALAAASAAGTGAAVSATTTPHHSPASSVNPTRHAPSVSGAVASPASVAVNVTGPPPPSGNGPSASSPGPGSSKK